MNLETLHTLQTFRLFVLKLSWKEAVLACDQDATIERSDTDTFSEFTTPRHQWDGYIGRKLVVTSFKGSDDCWRHMKVWCVQQLSKGWIPPIAGEDRPSKDGSKAAEQKRKDLNKKARDRYHKNRQIGLKNKPERVRATREAKVLRVLDLPEVADKYEYLGAIAQLTKKLSAFEKEELVSMLVAVLVNK